MNDKKIISKSVNRYGYRVCNITTQPSQVKISWLPFRYSMSHSRTGKYSAGSFIKIVVNTDKISTFSIFQCFVNISLSMSIFRLRSNACLFDGWCSLCIFEISISYVRIPMFKVSANHRTAKSSIQLKNHGKKSILKFFISKSEY